MLACQFHAIFTSITAFWARREEKSQQRKVFTFISDCSAFCHVLADAWNYVRGRVKPSSEASDFILISPRLAHSLRHERKTKEGDCDVFFEECLPHSVTRQDGREWNEKFHAFRSCLGEKTKRAASDVDAAILLSLRNIISMLCSGSNTYFPFISFGST